MPLRVAVVGTCASGKTSVSEALKERGYDAWAVAQEHSAIPDLWKHLHPDRLVYLGNTLETIRQRRDDPAWPGWIYETQLQRLALARDNADVLIWTDESPLHSVVASVVTSLDQAGSDHSR